MAQAKTSMALATLYREHVRLMVAGKVAELGDLLTSDFHLVHMTGTVQTKDEWLDDIATGAMDYHRAIEDDVTVTGENSVVGQDRVNATVWGSSGTWRLELALTCVENDGRWMIQNVQASTY